MNPGYILVVDDNPINRSLAAEVLECAGFAMETAADAEEALAAIEKSPPDLILMDIGLPGMDGLTLTRKIKANQKTRDIRIVALTAFAMKGDKETAIAAGCDGYITKPVDTRKLPEQVASFLENGDDSERAPGKLTP